MTAFIPLRIFKISFLTFFTFVSFFILPLVTCPLKGQVMQKKKLDQASYKLWSNFEIDQTAPDEKWVSYGINYAYKSDTLFLRNVADGRTYSFPSAVKSLFTKNNLFLFMKGDTLTTINPENGKKNIITSAAHYEYSYLNNLLLVYIRSEKNKGILRIKSPLGETLLEIPNVDKFSISPSGSRLLYNISLNAKNSLFLLDLKKLSVPEQLISTDENYYDNYTWQRNDKAVAFCSNSKAGDPVSLFLYTIADKKMYQLDPAILDNFPKGASIADASRNKMLISDDLKKVFFSVKNKSEAPLNQSDSKVEIWSTEDKWIYSQEQRNGNSSSTPKMAVWMPEQKLFRQITDNNLSSVMLSPDSRYAVLSDPKAYEPQFEFEGPRDYYLLDLVTFEKHLLLRKQPVLLHDISISPTGQYISYFKDRNWWIYSLKNKTHTNITSKTGIPFLGKVVALSADSPYGNAGWTTSDGEILLYDEFDLWAFKPDGSRNRRLTNGREAHIRYRLDLKPKTVNRKYLYEGLLHQQYDLKKTLLLRGENQNGQTGFYTWDAATGIKTIISNNSYFSNLITGLKRDTYFCMEQKFDLPPRMIALGNNSNEKCIFQSNPQHADFSWGRSELVSFQNSKNKNLKGVLYYPADYDPNKKYPMIVYIYEIQSGGLHRYWNPTLENESGYNPSIFTAAGYFVFLPDIVHEKENVGPSTLDCVLSGTKKIMETGHVDTKRIAIMGHSFGGYETSYVINQTNIFAAAIASGAITDLTRRYLTVGINTARPEIWRFASVGWRMGDKTPFSSREDFDRNSPLPNIENLQTPLLMWSGKEDTQVDPFQTTSYYMALRRLNKKNIMLLYPKENHTLLNPVNQKDLTIRVLQWFDYYLKDEKAPEWISGDI